MITQTAVNQNEAQGTLVRRLNNDVDGAQNWHTLETSSVIRSMVVDPNHRLTAPELASSHLRYGQNNGETTKSQRLTGILVLLLLSVVVGFLLTAAILNSAAGGNLEAFGILAVAVVGAIVGFFQLLKAARALDEIEYATHASDRLKRKIRTNH